MHEFYLSKKTKRNYKQKKKRIVKELKGAENFITYPVGAYATYRACSIDRILTNVWVHCFKIGRNLLEIKYPNVHSAEVAQQ